ncbi:hypothetical protein Psi02_21830 [Planotetraspora silvatica]|uniref:Uncharacterized protein n=1 Tax=Planotetraspora silvatica TaxID=234614 RepID=A0A8J3UHH5_9ACTN|nr:hypothetical protein Psi02_21830 [Planotetraspora silvatica]
MVAGAGLEAQLAAQHLRGGGAVCGGDGLQDVQAALQRVQHGLLTGLRLTHIPRPVPPSHGTEPLPLSVAAASATSFCPLTVRFHPRGVASA